MRNVLVVCFLLTLNGCASIPEGIQPVQNFEVNRYLGKWYEIARLDHSFERGLKQVTAQYTTREDGGIRVINRGFNTAKNQWQEAEGKAYFVSDGNIGHLKVSFFGPFYGAYIIFKLSEDYQYSLVTSNDRSYLWLLSRTPQIDDALKNALLIQMQNSGFDTESLIFVDHGLAGGKQ